MSELTDKWRKLRQDMGNLICLVNGKIEKLEAEETKAQKLQAKDDYYKRLDKDLNEALHIISAEDGMSVFDLINAFGTYSIYDIRLGFTPEEIIDKTFKWKNKRNEPQDQDQELHVGDEVTTDTGLIGIIIDDGDDDSIDSIVWLTYRVMSPARGLDSCWIYSSKCKKTGRHFDSIPFDYNPKKGD